MSLTPQNYKEVMFWSTFSLILIMIALSGCSVPKGDIKFNPVVTEELYYLEPYELNE